VLQLNPQILDKVVNDKPTSCAKLITAVKCLMTQVEVVHQFSITKYLSKAIEATTIGQIPKAPMTIGKNGKLTSTAKLLKVVKDDTHLPHPMFVERKVHY
jgi:hypothetical protein